MAVVSTSAVPLRAYPYGDTSLVLRFYTLDRGLVGAMAKGVRKSTGSGGSAPTTFSRGTLTLYVKEGRDLHTMKDYAPEVDRRGLAADVVRFSAASVLAADVVRFSAASVLAEILLRHAGEEGSPQLFSALDQGLDALASVPEGEIVSELLARGWFLVHAMGFLPEIRRCLACGNPIGEGEMTRFDLGAGAVRCSSCMGEGGGPRMGPGAREQLSALVQGRPVSDLGRPRAHLRLLEDFVTYHVSEGRPLDSVRILLDLL